MAKAWFSVGLASSFLDITESGTPLCDASGDKRPGSGCKVLLAPDESSHNTAAVQLSQDPKDQVDASLRKGEQVLVFKYNGKFHAIDNKCPHSSYPLSNATPFDIEDFGITLSAGITCPKHGWSFDLFTGTSDRGQYKLKIWETQLRPVTGAGEPDHEVEVWVRKKVRYG